MFYGTHRLKSVHKRRSANEVEWRSFLLLCQGGIDHVAHCENIALSFFDFYYRLKFFSTCKRYFLREI